MVKLKKIILFLSVLSLAIELPIFNIASSGIKLWMLAALAGAATLVIDFYKGGANRLKKSKILWLGLGLIFFSALGLVNSPLMAYSAKQLVILAALVILGVFFELNLKKYRQVAYAGLTIGIAVSALYAIYQNVAFEFGWPNFEAMSARPNGFLPEPDWLGFYLTLGLVPFLITIVDKKQSKTLPKLFHNPYLLYAFVTLVITAITITVARASWLALIGEMVIIIAIILYAGLRHNRPQQLPVGMTIKSKLFKTTLVIFSPILVSLVVINLFHLSRFDIPDRFRSIFFKEHAITVAVRPETGEKLKINLEDIESYRNQGYQIQEDYVRDENVVSREEKFTSTWDTIKSHPILGSGLGITLINTNYQHNANNLFLEWWASAGLGGLILIAVFLIYLLAKGLTLIRTNPLSSVLILAGTAGFIIVNLFNASIFLAFAWFYLAWLISNSE